MNWFAGWGFKSTTRWPIISCLCIQPKLAWKVLLSFDTYSDIGVDLLCWFRFYTDTGEGYLWWVIFIDCHYHNGGKNLHMQSWSTFRLLRKLASLWKFGITAGVGLRSGQIITCEGRPHPFPASAPYLVGIDVVFNWPVQPCAWLSSEISHFLALLHDIWIRILELWHLEST